MGYDGLANDFYEIAKLIAENIGSNDQKTKRTIIGRLYYSLYNIVLHHNSALQANIGNKHLMIYCASNTVDTTFNRVFQGLYHLRNSADYKPDDADKISEVNIARLMFDVDNIKKRKKIPLNLTK